MTKEHKRKRTFKEAETRKHQEGKETRGGVLW